MKKTSLIPLLALTVLLSGCLKFTSQEEFEANQKGLQNKKSITVDESLSLARDTINPPAVDENHEADAAVKTDTGASLKTDSEVQKDAPAPKDAEVKGDELSLAPTPEPTTQESPAAASTPAPTAPTPTPSVTLIPLDDIWKAAEFPAEYSHSYEINYPDSLNFFTGGDTDSFSAASIGNKKEAVVQIKDYSLTNCPAENIQCSMDERKLLTPSELLATIVAQNSAAGWSVTNKGVMLLQIKNPATQLVNAQDGWVMYVVQTNKGALSIAFTTEIFADSNFVKTMLKSLVSAK